MERERRHGYYAIRLVRVSGIGGDGRAGEQIASVKARDMSEAIALALHRYPGYIAIHGERH